MNDFNAFAKEVEQHILSIAQKTNHAPKDFYEHFVAFTSAINFNQNWIKIIGIIHLLLFITVIGTLDRFYLQSVLFFILLSIIFLLEYINTYASINWQLFSDQNYFDKHGVFIGVIIATPLIFICFIQLVSIMVCIYKQEYRTHIYILICTCIHIFSAVYLQHGIDSI